MSDHTPFCDVETALEHIRAGRMIVVIDDEDRENEGDLTMAAEKITPEAINFMAKYGRGLVCLAMTDERLDYLRLGQMSAENTSNFGTAFTESIDAKDGVTTGISAYDRSQTIQVAIDPATRPNDLARPGHVFPLRARKGGVLVRAGQAEASVDLARLAGLVPAGVICEIMSDDGTMARVPDLIEFCRKHGFKMLTVAELIRYRLRNERYIYRVAESMLPTPYGEFRMIAYESEVDGGESHLALVKGDVCTGDVPVLVRVHSHCLTGDVFGTTLCDCHSVMRRSLQAIAEAGCGALVYLHNTSKGFEIDRRTEPGRLVFHRTARGAHLEDHEHGVDPHSERARRTLREVGLGGQILSDLKISKIRLLSNTPTHVPALEGFGLEIVEQIPIPGEAVATSR